MHVGRDTGFDDGVECKLEYDGEYVSPFKLKFLENRKARREAGEALAAKMFDIEQVPADARVVDP